MKPRLTRLGVLLAVLVVLVAPTTPARASTTVKSVAFVGTAILGGGSGTGSGLGNPCTGTTIGVDTSQCPLIGVGTHRTFTFGSNICQEQSFGVKGKSGLDFCSISATGTLWGWCMLASGLGWITVDNLGPLLGGGVTKTLVTAPIHIIVVGGNFVVTGGTGPTTTFFTISGHDFKTTSPDPGGTTVLGTGLVIPPLPGSSGSCLDVSATAFTFVGDLLIET